MENDSAITRMPQILWYQVFKYLDIKIFVVLRAVCRKLKLNSDSYTEIYQRECLRIFTSDLELFK